MRRVSWKVDADDLSRFYSPAIWINTTSAGNSAQNKPSACCLGKSEQSASADPVTGNLAGANSPVKDPDSLRRPFWISDRARIMTPDTFAGPRAAL
jgi:hypothetical protein